MRRLTLVRHAKADRDDPLLPDRARPLADRGRRDAPEMARRMLARGLAPDGMVASPALRARSTAHLLARGIGFPEERIAEDERIYEATAGRLLTVVRELDPGCRHVVLVGHHPGLADLCTLLTGTPPDHFPTLGTAHLLIHEEEWRQVERGSADLVWFDYPKKPRP